MLDREEPNFPRPIQAALNVAGATAVKIRHRQRKELPSEKVENGRVDADRGEAEEILLQEVGNLGEDDHCSHPDQDHVEEARVVFDDHLIQDDLREDWEEKLEEA